MWKMMFTHDVTIIRNEDETPMFKASDIGAILGIKNMRDATSGFAEDQKCVVSNDANPTMHDNLFLTEKGVYRVLCRSRKPKVFLRQYNVHVARDFEGRHLLYARGYA